MRLPALFVLLSCLLALIARAPAAAPATAEADFSTPKSAAVTLFKAISAGDRDAVADGFYAADADQRALADAMADLIVAGKKLGDAAKEKFGRASDPIGRGMLDPSDLSKLDEATVKESADGMAVMTVPGQARPMSFRRQDGKWKLVVTDFSGAAPQNIEKQTGLVKAMAEAIDSSAADIAAGKFATPEQATNAIQQSLHQVMLAFYRPSTTRATTTTATTRP